MADGRDLATASDESLAARAGDGDGAAFAALVVRYRPRLVRYAARLLGGSGADPEDVVQDCLVAVLRSLRGGTRPARFGAWAHVVVRNRCIDAAQRRAREAVAEAAIGPATSPSVHECAAERERVRAVVDDIAALRLSQRRAVLAREFGGATYEQVAADEGITVSAVKSLLVRARASLRISAQERGLVIVPLAALGAPFRPLGQQLRRAAAACAAPAQKAAVLGTCAVLGTGAAVNAGRVTVPLPGGTSIGPPPEIMAAALLPTSSSARLAAGRGAGAHSAHAGWTAASGCPPGPRDVLAYAYEYEYEPSLAELGC